MVLPHQFCTDTGSCVLHSSVLAHQDVATNPALRQVTVSVVSHCGDRAQEQLLYFKLHLVVFYKVE